MTTSGIDPSVANAAIPTPGQGPWQSILGSVSNLLGTTPDDLRQSLRTGESLSDLASQKGISSDSLVSTIAGALQSTGASAPAGTDFNQVAQQIADRKRVEGHHHGGHHHHHAEAPQQGQDPSAAGPQDGSTVNFYA